MRQTSRRGDNLLRLSIKQETEDERLELHQHLAELRTRLIRSAFYVGIGMALMYWQFEPIFLRLVRPITDALHEIQARMPPDQRQFVGSFVFHSFVEPFFLQLKFSMIAGLIVSAPFILLEIYGFILPALTSTERRSVNMVAPLSVVLFAMGGSLAFFIMPAAVHWFLLYLGDFPGAVLLQDPEAYVLFLVKMILAFGLVFQLPVLMMGLGRLGIIRSSMLVTYWRYIVVGITIAAMIITPSNDPFSMIVMAVPMVILFFGSIWLVKLVEPKPQDA